MAQAEHFDALVLGSGPGGNLLAWHLARSGQRVAVVERRYIGGSCPNIACMPSKNVVWSARIAYLARHAAQFGTITGPVTTDMAKVRQRKRDMVVREIAAHFAPFKSTRRRTDHGQRKLRGAEDARGPVERRRHAAADRRQGLHQCRFACGDSEHSRPRRSAAAHAYRGTGPGLCTLAPDRARCRLCRLGTGAGLPPLRQPGDGDRDGAADLEPGGPGHRRGGARHSE